jgi:hypothetical protein
MKSQFVTRLLLSCAVGFFASQTSLAQFTGNIEFRPFVVGLIPVVGTGAVGGVSIDAGGVLARSDFDAAGRLREARQRAMLPIDSDLASSSRCRKISLRRLSAAIDERRLAKRPVEDAIQNLAGLTRIEFVFVFPEEHDIVFAGPAEGWRVDNQGNVVGRTSGQPMLQLDDLIVALRSSKAATSGRGISCSIDPTEEGLRRLRPLLKAATYSEATVERLEQALGPQHVTITGVPASSHFAHVLVAADFLMKRLGMNFERSPVAGLPSYMELLVSRTAPRPKSAMPRWWMAPKYDPLLKDADGLAWALRGTGVQTLTEDGYLGSSGSVTTTGHEDPLAKKWAEAMTDNYAALSKALPVFAELRNCVDLAVASALLVKEDLPRKADCDLSLLLDESRIAVAEYPIPKMIDSKASLIRKGRDWIISLSGGIQVDSWSALEHTETGPQLIKSRSAATPVNVERWWWD